MQSPDQFILAYEKATASHDLDGILSYIHDDAVYLFSNESVHIGKPAVEKVIRHNFEVIQAESYGISNLTWLAQSDQVAACVYDYAWSGAINGEKMSGFGRGTCVLKRSGDDWQIVHEHLSRGKFKS